MAFNRSDFGIVHFDDEIRCHVITSDTPTEEHPEGSKCPTHHRVHGAHGWYYCLVTNERGIPTPGNHSWYHDGDVDRVEPGTNVRPRGRLCQRCRFREGVVKDMLCFGSRTLWESAFEAGRIEGTWKERERIVARIVGL